MVKCITANIGTLARDISTYLETYFLDVEVKMQAELNELKHFCNILLKCSKERQLIERNDWRTLMMKFGIIGKTMTSNEKSFFGNTVVFYEHVESNFMVNELDFGLENHCSREITQQTTGKLGNGTAALG